MGSDGVGGDDQRTVPVTDRGEMLRLDWVSISNECSSVNLYSNYYYCVFRVPFVVRP